MLVQFGRGFRSSGACLFFACVATLALSLLPGSTSGQNDDGPSALAGIFTVTIGPEEVPVGLPDGAALSGRWVLTFADEGVFTLTRSDVGEAVSGTFDAGPATLEFTSWRGMIGCTLDSEEGATATYAWRRSDNRLMLTPIADTCPERLTLLTTHALGSLEVCGAPRPILSDPFSAAEHQGTPTPGTLPGQGVAAQEGYGEGSEVEAEIDQLLKEGSGCWAAVDADSFMALHSQGVISQIGFMGPREPFISELQRFMETPLRLERIGPVNLLDPGHAWAYIEVDLDGQATPQRMNFVLEHGAWYFDTFFLFGPPMPGLSGPPGMGP